MFQCIREEQGGESLECWHSIPLENDPNFPSSVTRTLWQIVEEAIFKLFLLPIPIWNFPQSPLPFFISITFLPKHASLPNDLPLYSLFCQSQYTPFPTPLFCSFRPSPKFKKKMNFLMKVECQNSSDSPSLSLSYHGRIFWLEIAQIAREQW